MLVKPFFPGLAKTMKRKNKDQMELEKQSEMLLLITRGLEEYMDGQPSLRGRKVDGMALKMAKRGVDDFFDYYHELQQQTTNSAEKAKLENVRKHVAGLLGHFQGPAMIPIEYLDDGSVNYIEYLEGNPDLLHSVLLDDLEEYLEPLPVILDDLDRKENEPPERLDLFNFNQILRRILAWSMDAQTQLAFAGKPKAGAALGKPRRCLIKSLMNTWELATGLPAREAYHGTNDHKGYKGILFTITNDCLVVAGFRPQSGNALGEEMDAVRRAREKKGFFLTGV